MFHLASRYLRRRLSVQTSGSARRRARERHHALATRADGERIARENREKRARLKRDEQREICEGLASYEPWGRAGGGAPNPRGNRYTDLRAGEIYPEDELRGITKFDLDCRRWAAPQQRWQRQRRSKRRLYENTHHYNEDPFRPAIENQDSYRKLSEQQMCYKEILDDMVDKRKIAERELRKKDLEYEKFMQAMDGPWGRPGPGGTIWRNPRSIGMNFSKSMGWTDNETFNKMKGENRNLKKSSLTLPKVKRDDDYLEQTKKAESVEKLPNINRKKTTEHRELTICKDVNIKNKKPRKAKFVKRLANGNRINRDDPQDIRKEPEKEYINSELDDNHKIGTKLTPEETILRSTGGVELVPLLARRRRFGARTLPSSDVTRPPEQDCQLKSIMGNRRRISCCYNDVTTFYRLHHHNIRHTESEWLPTWRHATNLNYLQDLKRQVQVKTSQKEAHRQESAEDVKQHHATWSSWWGRPGHGAPQRGRYARSNLAELLYAPPLPKIRV